MRTTMKQTTYLMMLSIFLLIAKDSVAMEPPISRQATLVERTSVTDFLIEATGIYISTETRERRIDRDLNDNGVREATKDAKKAAVWYLLSGSTDPMLNTPAAESSFRAHEAYFYNLDNIENYWITWEQSNHSKMRSRTPEGNGLMITKHFRINPELIRADLVRFNIIK